jgi:hypothetical protein
VRVSAAIGAVVGAILLVGGIVVGGYQLGWWLKANNTNRQQHIDRKNYGSQLAYQTKLESTITDVASIDVQLDSPNTPASEKAGLQGQRTAIVRQGCSAANLLTDIPSADAARVSSNC